MYDGTPTNRFDHQALSLRPRHGKRILTLRRSAQRATNLHGGRQAMDPPQRQYRPLRTDGHPALGTVAVEQLDFGLPDEQAQSSRIGVADTFVWHQLARRLSFHVALSGHLRHVGGRNGERLLSLRQPRHPHSPALSQSHRKQHGRNHHHLPTEDERSDQRRKFL